MMMFLKSTSSSIHSEQEAETGHDHEYQVKKKKEPASSSFTALTVWRKSLIVSCNGFTVIDSFGNLVYRVDNYKGPTKELILMDAAGKSILTMRRRHKALSLLDSWVVYEGDHDDEESDPRSETAAAAWWVKKCININSVFSTHHEAGVLAQVYRNSGCEAAAAYVVQGSYGRRSCRVLDESKRVVAEIRRKDDDPGTGVSFGLEVFHLVISDGFDPALAMALVLLLDQMFS